MLLVDDPVYDPPTHGLQTRPSRSPDTDMKAPGPALTLVRGGGSGQHLPRLPGAAREAAAIESLMPPDSVDRLDGFCGQPRAIPVIRGWTTTG